MGRDSVNNKTPLFDKHLMISAHTMFKTMFFFFEYVSVHPSTFLMIIMNQQKTYVNSMKTLQLLSLQLLILINLCVPAPLAPHKCVLVPRSLFAILCSEMLFSIWQLEILTVDDD